MKLEKYIKLLENLKSKHPNMEINKIYDFNPNTLIIDIKKTDLFDGELNGFKVIDHHFGWFEFEEIEVK